MQRTHPSRPPFMAVLEFDAQPAFPIPADSLDEIEDLAVTAAQELDGLIRVPVYEWRGPDEEYVLLQTLTRSEQTGPAA
jgi:hypothetical protein